MILSDQEFQARQIALKWALDTYPSSRVVASSETLEQRADRYLAYLLGRRWYPPDADKAA